MVRVTVSTPEDLFPPLRFISGATKLSKRPATCPEECLDEEDFRASPGMILAGEPGFPRDPFGADVDLRAFRCEVWRLNPPPLGDLDLAACEAHEQEQNQGNQQEQHDFLATGDLPR